MQPETRQPMHSVDEAVITGWSLSKQMQRLACYKNIIYSVVQFLK